VLPCLLKPADPPGAPPALLLLLLLAASRYDFTLEPLLLPMLLALCKLNAESPVVAAAAAAAAAAGPGAPAPPLLPLPPSKEDK
jgi:hypothetical protein